MVKHVQLVECHWGSRPRCMKCLFHKYEGPILSWAIPFESVNQPLFTAVRHTVLLRDLAKPLRFWDAIFHTKSFDGLVAV